MAAASTAAAFAVIFRIAVELIGLEMVGCWALIQALLMISRIGEVGIGVNLVRVVGIALRRRPDSSVRRFLLAGLLLSALPTTVIGLLLVAPVDAYVGGRYAQDIDPLAITLLVWLAVAFGVSNAVGLTVLAVLEGTGSIVARYALTIASNVVSAALAYPAIAKLGPAGLGAVYLVPTGIHTLGGLICLLLRRRVFTGDGDAGLSETLREVWVENAMVSATGLVRLTFEPVTKFALSAGGGLAMVAYFDLALRISTQFRVIVQSAVHPILVLGARERSERDDASILPAFVVAISALKRIVPLVMEGQLVAIVMLGALVLGNYSIVFSGMMVVLALANAINSMGVVGYYYSVSAGHVGAILTIHLIMAAINLVGATLGVLAGSAELIVAGYAIAFALGGLWLLRLLLVPLDVGILRFVATAWSPWLLARCAVWAAFSLSAVAWIDKTGMAVAAAGSFVLCLIPGLSILITLRDVLKRHSR